MAKENNEIVGFAGIVKIIDEIDIMNIVVRKDKRGLKIGSALLEKILEISKKLNAKTITLEVNEKNLPALNLYKKYKFYQIGLRKKYYNEDDAILLEKSFN